MNTIRIRHWLIHFSWLLQIRISHALQDLLARKNLVFTFNLSRLDRNLPFFLGNGKIPLPGLCIVMQGPVLMRGKLTLRICGNIRKIYPDVPLVLCTWEMKPKDLEEFENLGVVVKVCKPPESPGIGNINMQITSTRIGVEYALSIDSHYVLKMRTDTWFSQYDFLSLFCEEYLLFGGTKSGGPIIVTSFNTSQFRLFSINDQVQFGHITNIHQFWSSPLDYRDISQLPFSIDSKSHIEFARNRLAEVWLVTNYLESLGLRFKFDVDSYEQVLAHYFVVIDESAIGFVWFKSVLRDSQHMRESRTDDMGMACLTRAQWLNLYRRLLHSSF